jgi:CelD/BcsL family acetyltransferase involved in cellulose biosynthesis
MTYAFRHLDFRCEKRPGTINAHQGTIFQTAEWLAFLVQTQSGEPVVAELKYGEETIGYFTGMVVQKFGFRVLGSPFPGWSTSYMGLSLLPEVNRSQALNALFEFAFRELGCVHMEMMDRRLTPDDLAGLNVQCRMYQGFEINLSLTEKELFAAMTSSCRRCIRKAEKEGVIVEEAHDLEFADEYYAQLRDVFAKQSLVPTYGIERVRELIKHVHPTGHLLLLRARDRSGHCVATGIFPHMNGVIYFWGGASWRRTQELRPNEALQWHAMKIARQRGLHTYDMGGGGEYKRKYGGREIMVPWFRKSKYPWFCHMRAIAEVGYKVSQRCMGQLNRIRNCKNAMKTDSAFMARKETN